VEWIADPTAWLGLGTLVALELVLGVDNLLIIAILADKLPPEQRNRARIVGLSLALLMRLLLLASISWVVGLTRPLFTVLGVAVSGRDLILVLGGLFLLFKATVELHERLEGAHLRRGTAGGHSSFWQVIAQIVVMDAVFSLDSVVTAVGMVDQLAVMMIAVVLAVVLMIAASRPLMEFVTGHPTVVVLCLGFLLMIGFSLIADGLGFHVPKGYLYAAIGFSVLIEALNQFARRNRLRHAAAGDLRERTAAAVLRLLGGGRERTATTSAEDAAAAEPEPEPELPPPPGDGGAPPFAPEERAMVQGVMALGERTVRSIMTPRPEVVWLDLDAPPEEARRILLEGGRSRFPVARGTLDELAGVALARDLLRDLLEGGRIRAERSVRPPLVVPDGLGVLAAMERLRGAPVPMAVVVDEHGSVEGVVTPTDVLEAIAGEFPEGGDAPLRMEEQPDGSWLVDAQMDLHRLGHRLGADLAAGAEGRYATLAGYLMWRLGRLPAEGDTIAGEGFEFEVVARAGLRLDLVRVRPEAPRSAAA
jgi:CBS domain containing-hemolysin-like protein